MQPVVTALGGSGWESRTTIAFPDGSGAGIPSGRVQLPWLEFNQD